MSYRKAWLLLDALNGAFRRLVVPPRGGGAGGDNLTPFGTPLVNRHRSIEHAALAAVDSDLRALDDALA